MFEIMSAKMDVNNIQIASFSEEIKNQVKILDSKLDSKINKLHQETETISTMDLSTLRVL